MKASEAPVPAALTCPVDRYTAHQDPANSGAHIAYRCSRCGLIVKVARGQFARKAVRDAMQRARLA